MEAMFNRTRRDWLPTGDVRGNGKDRDAMRFPREWKYDQSRDGNGNKMHGSEN